MTTVEVATGSRLHFGLLCAAPETEWHYGGIGMMIDCPGWRIELSASRGTTDNIDASTPVKERLIPLLDSFRSAIDGLPPVHIRTLQEVRLHSGLGSGTQLTLAAGTAMLIAAGHPRPDSITQLAQQLGRNRRSAIGTTGFDRGGFLVDHGRSGTHDPAIERFRFPDEWRMVIVTPLNKAGLSGETEECFFEERDYLGCDVVSELAALIQQEIVPSVLSASFTEFRRSLEQYGSRAGEYYADAQGGIFSNTRIQDLVDHLQRQGVSGAVQSSWGPSISIPAASQEEADWIAEHISTLDSQTEFSITIARGRNSGVTVTTPAPAAYRTFG